MKFLKVKKFSNDGNGEMLLINLNHIISVEPSFKNNIASLFLSDRKFCVTVAHSFEDIESAILALSEIFVVNNINS